MTSINVKVTARPLKIAFVVDPNDRGAVLQAFSLASSNWGGIFYPIIPMAIAESVGGLVIENVQPSTSQLLKGFAEAFEPDFYLPLGDAGNNEDVNRLPNKIAEADLLPFENLHYQRVGVSILSVIEDYYRNEYRFQVKRPQQFLQPGFDQQDELLAACVFGRLPDSLQAIFRDRFGQLIDLDHVLVQAGNVGQFIGEQYMYPTRLARWQVVVDPKWIESSEILVFDAASAHDLIYLWNRRASGRKVIPLPIQAVSVPASVSLIQTYLDSCQPGGSSAGDSPVFTRTRSITQQQFTEATNKFPNPPDIGNGTYSTRRNSAEFWEGNFRQHNSANVATITSVRMTESVNLENKYLSFSTVVPGFIGESLLAEYVLANDVELQSFVKEPLIAEVLPSGNDALVNSIALHSPRNWRIKSNGLSNLIRESANSIDLYVPDPEAVFTEWFRASEWSIQLSAPAGRTAKQMLKHLKGIYGVNILAIKGMLELLGNMNRDATMSIEQFRGSLSRMINTNRMGATAAGLTRALIDKNILRLGLNVQCDICSMRSWFSVKEVDYSLTCPKCHADFTIPSHVPGEMAWAYRPLGPFALPSQAYGSYCVLLTLRFFALSLNVSLTPMLSFEARKNDACLEADLGLFLRFIDRTSSPVEVVFAECKSFQALALADLEKMSLLGREFPGSCLIFCTLKDEFSPEERDILATLVNENRKNMAKFQPHNPIITLTGKELMESGRSVGAFRSGYQLSESLERQLNTVALFRDYADITQQLHLSLRPFHEVREELANS